MEELKQAASNGEAGLVRRTAPAGNQRLSECCTRQGLELEQWRCDTVGFGNSRAKPITTVPMRTFFYQARWIMIIFDLLEAFFLLIPGASSAIIYTVIPVSSWLSAEN